jgi:hypothetical protein
MSTDHDLVKTSYGRCCLSSGFFDEFYATFTASSPVIRDKFKNTDMKKQKDLLRDGITFMILFASGSAMATNKINMLGQSHAKARLDIAPNLYPYWVDALVATASKHDKQWTPDLAAAWRRIMAKGIDVMKGMYESGSGKR